MSSKNNGLSVSHGTVLSVVCLLLYSAGFIRIELKFNDHDQRLMAVEEVISQMKHGMADTWKKGKVLTGVSGNCLNVLKPLPLLPFPYRSSLSLISNTISFPEEKNDLGLDMNPLSKGMIS